MMDEINYIQVIMGKEAQEKFLHSGRFRKVSYLNVGIFILGQPHGGFGGIVLTVVPLLCIGLRWEHSVSGYELPFQG